MYIQMFCYNEAETKTAFQIVEFAKSIDPQLTDTQFRMEVLYNIKAAFQHPKESSDWKEVENYLLDYYNEELDNIGVYYNSGDFIYIRIFKEAKVDHGAFKN